MDTDYPQNRQRSVLELDSRKEIYDLVAQYAGCHMREIQRVSGLSFGQVSYHLSCLQRHGLVRKAYDGNHLRYFPATAEILSDRLLVLLRQRSVRKILLSILADEGCSHQDIVSSVRLSPSTVTWHLKKLTDEGIIHTERQGRYNAYYMDVPVAAIRDLLVTYRESFVDSMVDGLIELWE